MRGNCKSSCGSRCCRFLAWAVIGLGVGGYVVMLLWNWLIPVIFGWKAIGFVQAIGLLLLSRILFGGFHGRCGHGHRYMAARLEAMTPEEREKFQAGMKSKWWCCKPSATDGTEPADKQ